MSSLVPIRRAGFVSPTCSCSFALPSAPRASHAPVSIVPGEIALTRIGASSTASERVRVSAAPLVMATASVPTVILNAASPEKITNDPPSPSRRASAAIEASSVTSTVSTENPGSS
jgi:hypothetical protein